jgi:hypothetical protein
MTVLSNGYLKSYHSLKQEAPLYKRWGSSHARYIDYLGYGMEDENIDEFTIKSFIKNLNIFKKNLMSYERKDNNEFFEKLEKKIYEIVNL